MNSSPDHFSETFPSMNRRDRDEDGYYSNEPYFEKPECENCGRTVERLALVPRFNYLGCDDCMAEALAIIAEESKVQLQISQTAELLDNAGCTPAEAAAYVAILEPQLCPTRYAIFGRRSLTLRAMAIELKAHTARCVICTREEAA